MFTWLTQAGPMGILHNPVIGGVFPDSSDTPECKPDEITCDPATFTNYPGVEEQPVTEDEMTKHIDKEHVVAFSTGKQLIGLVDGKPILNKLGLIVKSQRRHESSHDLGYKNEWGEACGGESRTRNSPTTI